MRFLMRASTRQPSGLAIRITAAAVAAAAVAMGVVAVGILIVARSTFEHLMVHAGSSAVAAQDMFDQSVATIFAVATGVAAVVTACVSIVLARRIARPLEHMKTLARRISDGDYAVRIPRGGAAEVAAVAESFNQMAASLADQERVRTDFIV
ncbi:MAG: HAMP domain-containing protein, partial [Candidatus Dormibacteraeota bacterium]|nr:HAMP domain-containing protein [Candidatus Dormibacteraeota bacterium]